MSAKDTLTQANVIAESARMAASRIKELRTFLFGTYPEPATKPEEIATNSYFGNLDSELASIRGSIVEIQDCLHSLERDLGLRDEVPVETPY